jgi:SAM-dependent methyltransferase/uncharacterized protein YbaR (Trm112 family)
VTMRPWLLEVLACPGCGGRLAIAPGRAVMLACRRCDARYPVLGGAPVVVPSPAEYLAGYRDAALATLAERGRATRAAVAVIDGFAAAAGKREPLAFGDDWVEREGDALPPAASARFAAFLDEAEGALDAAILAALPRRRATIVEVGAGAGVLARTLARTEGVERLVVADLSLRAVLRAVERAGKRAHAEVAGVVLDAEALPLAPRRADAIVAAELIDLLDAPERFLAGAAAALRPRGRLILATPDPALGGDDDRRLRAVLAADGWRVIVHVPAVPWIRPHGPRHHQVYFADVLAAERA